MQHLRGGISVKECRSWGTVERAVVRSLPSRVPVGFILPATHLLLGRLGLREVWAQTATSTASLTCPTFSSRLLSDYHTPGLSHLPLLSRGGGAEFIWTLIPLPPNPNGAFAWVVGLWAKGQRLWDSVRHQQMWKQSHLPTLSFGVELGDK